MIIARDKDCVWVQCGQGQLGIKEIQFPGKKRVFITQLQGYEAILGHGQRFET